MCQIPLIPHILLRYTKAREPGNEANLFKLLPLLQRMKKPWQHIALCLESTQAVNFVFRLWGRERIANDLGSDYLPLMSLSGMETLHLILWSMCFVVAVWQWSQSLVISANWPWCHFRSYSWLCSWLETKKEKCLHMTSYLCGLSAYVFFFSVYYKDEAWGRSGARLVYTNCYQCDSRKYLRGGEEFTSTHKHIGF